MNTHFTFHERVILQYFIERNHRGTVIEIAEILGKSRQAIYYELKQNVHSFTPISVKYNKSQGVLNCPHLRRFPFCCNSCARTLCSNRCKEYDAYIAHDKAHRQLIDSRVNTHHKKQVITVLDKTLSQLIIDGQSIHVAMLSVNRCDVSESTIRRYINNGLLLAKRHHLPNAVRFKVKKEYNYSRKRINVKTLYKRTYEDYLEYIKANPKAKVIQIDSVIGKSNDKYALLTIFFLNSKFQLGIKYTRKGSTINSILIRLYNIALEHGYKLFDVVLADNGTEFMKLPDIEKGEDNEVRCHVFYCDPYRSCQKAECERNHGFIRRIFRKGKSFNLIEQSEFDVALSHINSYPRGSLNNRTPYELFATEYSSIIACCFNIDKIDAKDVVLKATR